MVITAGIIISTRGFSLNLVDSHCHLDRIDLTPYQGDLAQALEAARMLDVKHFLCVCIDMFNYHDVLSIAKKFDRVHATVGLHPTEVVSQEPSVEKLIECAQDPKIVALGETGLDFFHVETTADIQINRFKTHIRAARELNKPLVVHTRQAREETLAILQQEKAQEVGGVLHCFTEDWDMASRAMDLGFYISFSGIVTFKNAKELQEIAQKIPLERMLIETDAPYLAPVPYRGKTNQPAYVRYVAEFIAQLRDQPLNLIAEKTTENFQRLFKILIEQD